MNKKMIVPNLSYTEVVYSKTALENKISNIPNSEQLENIVELAKNIFTPLRNHFNKPIKVTSFFRSRELNTLIGGSLSSQHMSLNGSAMDIQGTDGVSNREIFDFIKNNLDFDQLIWEFGNSNNPKWVHVSYNKLYNRKQILKARKINGKTIYSNY